MFERISATAVATLVVLSGCSSSPPEPLIFVDGRAVEPMAGVGLGVTNDGAGGLVVMHPENGTADTVGRRELRSPLHVQAMHGRWYVSDVEGEKRFIVVFDSAGRMERRLDVTRRTPVPHQFAVLPDERVVLIGDDERLIVLDGDSTGTWQLTEAGTRPSLLLGTHGGVLHAVPGRHLTLYNGFGNIRWRIEWPWRETAWVSDLAQDPKGRIHLIAGITGRAEETFIVYSLVPETGEVVRWSKPGPYATFTVGPRGGVHPDSLAGSGF